MAALDTKTILQERRDLDFSTKIAELEPDAGPLTVLLKKLGKTSVDSAEFNWFEFERNPRWTTFAGTTETVPGTSITVATGTGAYFRVSDLIKVPRTDEVMLVTAVSGDTVTVVRGYGSTAAANLTNGDSLLLMANAYQENDVPGAMKVGQPVKERNYTQIFKNPVEISKTLDAEKQRANPKERARLQRQAGIEHLIDIEYALWFGEPKEDLTGTHPRRTTGGVLYWATENIMDVASANAGALTYALLEQWAEVAFRYGASTKWLFACPRLISVIDTIAAKQIQTRPKEETYGVSVKQLVTGHGIINIVKHHLFEGSEYGKMGVLLDLSVDEFSYVYLPGRDTTLQLNVGEASRDGYLDVWQTECGLRFKQPKRHAVITGVTSAA